MDIRMPNVNGVEATRLLRMHHPQTPRILILTTFSADENVRAALSAGADGFLVKDTPPDQLVSAIRRVAAGEHVLSSDVITSVVRLLRDSEPVPSGPTEASRTFDKLTPRQQEVARAVALGLTDAQIAAQVHLAVPTLKAMLKTIRDEFAAANRTQLAIAVHEALRAPDRRRDADASLDRRPHVD